MAMNVAAYAGMASAAPGFPFAPSAGPAVAAAATTASVASLAKSVREYVCRERAAAGERAKEREQMRARVLECVNWVGRFSGKAAELDQQYRSSQHHRRFVLDLIECFDEKVLALERSLAVAFSRSLVSTSNISSFSTTCISSYMLS